MGHIKIGLALGSGAARGWAHFGVINALRRMDIAIDVVAGSSVGSLVGAAYVTGRLDEMEQWVLGFRYWDVIRQMDLSWHRGGLLRGDRVFTNVKRLLGSYLIEECDVRFGAVATNLSTGRELWMTSGDLHQAIRASCSLPGLLSPVKYNDYWLVDGAVVNPVPISLTRALGADVVIAVDLQQDASLNQQSFMPLRPPEQPASARMMAGWRGRIRQRLGRRGAPRSHQSTPTAMDIMSTSIQVLENRLKMTRMAGDPPDVLIQPYCPQIATLDFHRAAEAIEAGRLAVEKKIEELLPLVKK